MEESKKENKNIKPRSEGELQAIKNGILNQRSKAIEERMESRKVGNQISRICCLSQKEGRKNLSFSLDDCAEGDTNH